MVIHEESWCGVDLDAALSVNAPDIPVCGAKWFELRKNIRMRLVTAYDRM